MNIDAPKQTRKKGKPHGGKGGAEPQSTVQRREHEVLERRASVNRSTRSRRRWASVSLPCPRFSAASVPAGRVRIKHCSINIGLKPRRR